jgi:hypothetical protein
MEKLGLGGGIFCIVFGIVLTKVGNWPYGLPVVLLGVGTIVYTLFGKNIFG